MAELKPCPFCGGEARRDYGLFCHEVYCRGCQAIIRRDGMDEAVEAWNRRTPEFVKVETNIFDKEEIYPDCTVQVLTNTATGETSVGWWNNGT